MRLEDLHGKIAVVTGGGSGLGAAMCRELARAGMAVGVLDIDEAAASETAGSIGAEFGVASSALQVDVGDSDSVREAAAAVAETFGGCDVLCANVGVQQFGAIDRLTEDDWTWVLNVNVLGTVRTVASFLPLLRAREGLRRVVLTASSGAFIPGIRLGAYQTSKYAIVGYGETLRQELADEGIGVMIVFPAGMTTRHLESSARARPADKGEWVLLPDDVDAMMAGRNLGPEHVATAEHAVRNLLADLLADEPYLITHGDYRGQYHARLAAIEAAFDRMERP
jgi:meso-butanediol dehydrogenase / (S,S)-butanediol dehydrogenase / diacetyl reductase